MINYSTLNRRVTALMIDAMILLFILMPIMEELTKYIFGSRTFDVIMQELSTEYTTITAEVLFDKLSREHFWSKYLLLQLISLTFMSIYTLGFWFWISATPGKWLCSCMIVDAKTLARPTKFKLVMRLICTLFSYITLGIGFIMIYFSKSNQALHDKMVGTLVVNYQPTFKIIDFLKAKLLSKKSLPSNR